ncbi:MAG TPA: aminotransferase class V-fold PLP-dependent enzyme [Acidimicrobiales bacterium]|nr:aminotransferase class V-fold PLP-dependent enzyme [Acidimicrobiales bacterium]
MLDVDRARALTPGCAAVVHLNHAGASLLPAPVLDTVVAHLRREAEIGGYEAADEAAGRLWDVYRSAARLLGCDPEEVALVENATRAWDMAFYSLRFEPGDRILIGRAEYVSNAIAQLQAARRHGAMVEVVDDDEHGQIDVAALERRIDDRVRLIALTHVPTNGGLVNPAAEVGRLARAAGVPYLLDACQSAGQLPLDVAELGCDMLSFTGRKYVRGPRGTGVLYVRRGLIGDLDPPFVEVGSATWTGPDRYELAPDARRFETWERSVAGLLGLGAAIDHALGWGVEAIEARVTALGEALRDRLRAVEGVTVHDKGARRCGVVTFTVKGVEAAEVRRRLAAGRINTSVSRRDQAQLDLPRRALGDLVRASVHYVNTEEELDRAAAAVAGLGRS